MNTLPLSKGLENFQNIEMKRDLLHARKAIYILFHKIFPENKSLKSSVLIYCNTIAICIIIIWFGDINNKIIFFDGAASRIVL